MRITRISRMEYLYIFPVIIYVFLLGQNHMHRRMFDKRVDETIETMGERFDRDGLSAEERRHITSALQSLQNSTRSLVDGATMSAAGGIFLACMFSVTVGLLSVRLATERQNDGLRGAKKPDD